MDCRLLCSSQARFKSSLTKISLTRKSKALFESVSCGRLCGLITNDRRPRESGERTRPACWRARLAIANFWWTLDIADSRSLKERLFRRDAETNTRDACAPQKRNLRGRVIS